MAMLQVEALENWSAKFLDIVLEHTCALQSLKQLCQGELLKVQLQEGTAIVHLMLSPTVRVIEWFGSEVSQRSSGFNTPSSWAGTLSTKPGCSNLHPALP